MSVKLYKPYLNLFNRISLLQKIAKDFAEVGEQITSDTYLRCFFEFNCFSTSVKILLPYILNYILGNNGGICAARRYRLGFCKKFFFFVPFGTHAPN